MDTWTTDTGTQGHTAQGHRDIFTPAHKAMDMDKDMYMDVGYGH